jgi:magnesium transporter
VPNLVPTILVRKEAILVCKVVPFYQNSFHRVYKVNILHIRALVKADAVVLFDTYGSVDSRLHSVFLYHLEVSPLDDRHNLVLIL